MMKKLLVSLLSALLCISVVAEPEIQSNENDVKIEENGFGFVPSLKYHISDEGTAEVIWNRSYKDMESVVIPSEIKIAGHVYPVTSIGYRAFDGCSGLTNVNIPSSVTSIGVWSFCGCGGLTSIEIPSSVTHIDISAFDDCGGLTSINVSIDNSNYSSEDGILYDKNKTTLVSIPEGKKGRVVLLSGVACIGEYACRGCGNLTSLEIPSSVTSIEFGAFSGCRGLTSIDIPSSVTSIGRSVFMNCSGLTTIKIPSGVTSIGDHAFASCRGLTSIKIPSSVTNIGGGAFYRCENLEIVIDNSKENISVGENAFYGCKSVKFLK